MKMDPLVSCIIIFFNAEQFLAEAINSVAAQTYVSWELLLVDDGSTDRSAALARQYAHMFPDKVRYLDHPGQVNRGMSAARNLGISHSRGVYLAFLDADDVWLPHKLARQVALLSAHPEAAMVYGRMQLWHSWSAAPPLADSFMELGVPANRVVNPPRLLVTLLQSRSQTPGTSNAMLRRDCVEKLGAFVDSFRDLFEDQVFFAKVLRAHPAYVADEYWVRYRQHAGSATAFFAHREDHVSAFCTAKLRFLRWLSAYLVARKDWSPQVWLALNKERWICEHPRLLSAWRWLKR